MFICTSPMKPGVRPGEETVAGAEPMVADDGRGRVRQRVGCAGVPSLAAGEPGRTRSGTRRSCCRLGAGLEGSLSE